MKRTTLMLIAFFLSISAAKAETITLVGDPWCPYNCEPGSSEPGLLVEVAREVFKEKGIEVKYQTVPWSRAIDGVRQNKYTAIVGAYKEDAPDFIFPTVSIARSIDKFYITKNSNVTWKYKGPESMKDVSVGLIQDYSYGADIDNYIAKNKHDTAKIQLASGDNALEQNVKKLMAGRVQVIVEDAAVMHHYLKSTGQSDILNLVGTHTGENVYIGFSPNNPKSQQYAKILSEGITKFKASGKLKVIKAKYGVQ